VNIQSRRRHAALSLPTRNSIILAAASAAVGAAAVLGWQYYEDDSDRAAPTTTLIAQPASVVTSDSIQPSSRGASFPRHFTGRTGHVDSDGSVFLDFINEPVTPLDSHYPFPPSYPESREGKRGHVSAE
jgi:hypothetical protein